MGSHDIDPTMQPQMGDPSEADKAAQEQVEREFTAEVEAVVLKILKRAAVPDMYVGRMGYLVDNDLISQYGNGEVKVVGRNPEKGNPVVSLEVEGSFPGTLTISPNQIRTSQQMYDARTRVEEHLKSK
jgi:hypothetical protein